MDNEVKSDKGKIIGLVFIIIIVVILIIGFFILAVLDLTKKADNSVELSTTTRRSVTVDNNPKVEETTTEATTTTTTTEVVSENVVQATTISVPKKEKTTTQAVVEEEEEEEITPEVTPSTPVIENKPVSNRTIITSETTYPDAINSYEWEIVNYINEERKKNGLNELSVAKELRDLAEGGAEEYCKTNNDSSVSSYLRGYSNFRLLSYRTSSTSLDFYTKAKNSTKVTTSSLSYLGVGVIYKSCSLRTPGYYFVLIYE